MEDLSRKLQSEVDNMKLSQKELEKLISAGQQLECQLNENQAVQDELNFLKSESLVYKSVGPVLIKTDLAEAKQNVKKRMEFITKELKRVDEQIQACEKKQDVHRDNLQKLQQVFQQAQVKAAINA